MKDNDFNIIKPVGGLQNSIPADTVKRRRRRKQQPEKKQQNDSSEKNSETDEPLENSENDNSNHQGHHLDFQA
jgi:hypothetical protein